MIIDLFFYFVFIHVIIEYYRVFLQQLVSTFFCEYFVKLFAENKQE